MRNIPHHMASTKLHDLMNGSTRFEDLFKKSQLQTQEVKQFKGNKPAAFCDGPMHWWESTLKFYTKLKKLLLSVENCLAEIDEDKPRIPNKHLLTQFISLKRILLLITVATEIDVLEKFVHFTNQVGYTDHDVSLFLEQIEDVHGDLSRLLRRPGKHFKMMTERLVNGDLKVWHPVVCDIASVAWNQLKEEELRDLKCVAVFKLWDAGFPDRKRQLKMLLLFSMETFRK